MSYRTYLKSLPKEDFNIITNLNEEKIIEFVNIKEKENFKNDEFYLSIKHIGDEILQIYDINKELENKIKTKFFLEEKLNNLVEDYGHQLFLINKTGLLEIIKLYNEEIIQNKLNSLNKLEKLVNEDNKTIINERETFYFLRDLKRDLEIDLLKLGVKEKEVKGNLKKYIIGSKNILVNETKLEYEIFNLIYIYNTFDFEKNVLIVEGS